MHNLEEENNEFYSILIFLHLQKLICRSNKEFMINE
jgi:hypothetical protein